MGLLSSAKKKAKKFLKSDVGKIALLAAAYQWGPAALQPGQGLRGLSGWQQALTAKAPWLYTAGTQTSPETMLYQGKDFILPQAKPIPAGGILGKAAGFAKAHPYITAGGAAAGLGYATMEEEDLPEEFTDDSGQQQYLKNRALYEDEWSDWLMDMNPGMSKTEALDQVRSKPMFSEGGRVKAQGGLFAGQMPGRNPGMNPMAMNQGNPMAMNQGLGAPNLGPRSMGMTPGMGQQPMDPRMAQMMQGQRGPTRAVPKESEDTELIQLIKMLTALGIPMEQLRGRTKEELVEMLVAVSGKGKGGTEIIEGEAIEERGGEEVEAAEEEVIQAAHGGRIGLAKGQNVPLQAGAQNYLGEQEMVTVPQHWKSGKDHPETELAYITKPELDLILKADFHGSLKDGPNKGPGGVMSLNDPATGRTGAEMSTMETTGRDPRTGKVTRESSGIRYGVINASRTGTTDGTTGTTDGNIISNFFNKQNAYNINKRNKHISDFIFANPRNKQMLIDKGIITEEQGDIDEMVLGHELPAWRWEGDIGSTGSLKQLQNLTGYTGGITTPGTGGGGGGQSYATAGGGTGTTTPTDGDDYYKFAEWDKWLMPGETTATPLMPGGYKKEILANTGGLMRTGYALGHPVIPSKDGPQLDMRDAGGYQPHGKAEKHDDVRALLAQGEFVMTSDAVKGMGGGDREMGAKKMYNLMHNMEAMA